MLEEYWRHGETCIDMQRHDIMYSSLTWQPNSFASPQILGKSFDMPCPTVIEPQYHRQQCTLHAFEQFATLYIANHVDKYSTRPVLLNLPNRKSDPRKVLRPHTLSHEPEAQCFWYLQQINMLLSQYFFLFKSNYRLIQNVESPNFKSKSSYRPYW